MPLPRPLVTNVVMNAMFLRSPTGGFLVRIGLQWKILENGQRDRKDELCDFLDGFTFTSQDSFDHFQVADFEKTQISRD